MGEIYKITNKINGKCYVGKTKHSSTIRWCDHINGYHPTSLIHQAIIKYGVDNFSFEIIEKNITEEKLNDLEIKYIAECDSKTPNGYNLTDGGDGGLGLVVSETTKLKLSEVRKGKPWTKRQREVLSKAKIGNNNAGKRVEMIENEMVVATFNSITDASNKTGICRTTISRSCNHPNLKAGGYHWRYCRKE